MQYAIHYQYRNQPHALRGAREPGENRLLTCVKVTPVWLCCTVGVLLAINVLLFAELLRSPPSQPVPRNDFSRIINRAELYAGERRKAPPRPGPPHRMRCKCDPRKSPSRALHCSIGKFGNMQQRFVNRQERGSPPLFKCIRTGKAAADANGCICCDCGTEKRSLVLGARQIRRLADACAACETPAGGDAGGVLAAAGRTVVFAGGRAGLGRVDSGAGVTTTAAAAGGVVGRARAARHGDGGGGSSGGGGATVQHQLLFSAPLGVNYDFEAFRATLTVDGDFTATDDNDPIVGLLDMDSEGGGGTVWAAQRGDNGIWFSIGKYHTREVEVAAEVEAGAAAEAAATRDSAGAGAGAGYRPQHAEGGGVGGAGHGGGGAGRRTLIAKYDPYVMHFVERGSTAARFGVTVEHSNKGRGETLFTMDNDLTDNGGTFDVVASWRRFGWAATGNASALYFVAFRDDASEQYAFRKVAIEYEKL